MICTSGTHYNIQCPHCLKNNHNVSSGEVVELRSIKSFSKPCFYCKKTILYRASYEMVVNAADCEEAFLLAFPAEIAQKVWSDYSEGES